METAITHNIKVTVSAVYQPDYSRPLRSEFVFAYQIRIDNLGKRPLQLLSRYWLIWDSNGSQREVEGEGVVGQQPVLYAGDFHEYVSACPLQSDIGYMQGYYVMRYLDGEEEEVKVIVPRFRLQTPFKNN
ncbi:uncharacterized protein affecting Mg2+/Co2+ transport [Saprospira grandis DSM 2844]|uniref:Uncharacterized protein affecting Mg2+/Co2+ transport n=1 Tax=Saprospira grandis DSM 2844 TaxID=694433 RepID=J0P521_9BACT|nr:Co2+/Mg2+ efflux protein ApaG [Saprospira grandis]EJF54979.1 uncharacterized protein affecting Mg2+/Co2+ transport [Saprospira grandis DSM 2844]